MAKIEFDLPIKNLKGKMGGLAFRKSATGELTIIKRADMSGVKRSKAQKEAQQRIKRADKYAKAALADPKVRTIYEKIAKKRHSHPYHMAVSDYYKGKNLLEK